MTREEAINELKRHKARFNADFGWNTTTLTALDMAIKALEQEPFDEIIDKTVKEIFAQSKLINPNYSKDWNEGFDDGMFHTITIINGIRKAEIE